MVKLLSLFGYLKYVILVNSKILVTLSVTSLVIIVYAVYWLFMLRFEDTTKYKQVMKYLKKLAVFGILVDLIIITSTALLMGDYNGW